MDSNDELKDDFLADMIRKIPLESPSDAFVEKVMKEIDPGFSFTIEKPSYFSLIGPFLLVSGILGMIIFIFCTSDIPFFNILWGHNSILSSLNHIFYPFMNSMRSLLASKSVTYSLLIGLSAVIFFVLDKIFTRRLSV